MKYGMLPFFTDGCPPSLSSVSFPTILNSLGIKAPATTGHPIFERTFRVHYNTLENLVIFLPRYGCFFHDDVFFFFSSYSKLICDSLWMFSYYVNPRYAGILGAVFCFARLVYGGMKLWISGF